MSKVAQVKTKRMRDASQRNRLGKRQLEVLIEALRKYERLGLVQWVCPRAELADRAAAIAQGRSPDRPRRRAIGVVGSIS